MVRLRVVDLGMVRFDELYKDTLTAPFMRDR
jgi:hypothetical protein